MIQSFYYSLLYGVEVQKLPKADMQSGTDRFNKEMSNAETVTSNKCRNKKGE